MIAMDLHQRIMSMKFKDRVDCLSCNKEVVSTNGRPVTKCPHCGASIMDTLWMPEDILHDVWEQSHRKK
jgi:ribosomal protein L37AE/L43A